MKTVLALLCLCASLSAVDVHPDELKLQPGDLVFQSLPHGELVDAIESSTQSPYSHCGMVVKKDDTLVVLEAIGPVRETELFAWVIRGREAKVTVCRLIDQDAVPKMIDEAYKFIGRPYDMRYRMDDENIYCSELIYKAMLNAHGVVLAQPDKLGDLQWEPVVSVIKSIEGDNVPLDRAIITPVALTKSALVTIIYSDFAE